MPNKANRGWSSTWFILALTWLFAASLLWSSIRHKGRGLGGSARGGHFEPVRQNGPLYRKALWAGSEVCKQDRASPHLRGSTVPYPAERGFRKVLDRTFYPNSLCQIFAMNLTLI